MNLMYITYLFFLKGLFLDAFLLEILFQIKTLRTIRHISQLYSNNATLYII